MEAKLSDKLLRGMKHKIDPHHLTTARIRLLSAKVIERRYDRTRGSQVLATYTLADPTKNALRDAARKRLLHARFMSWSANPNKWGAAPIPTALERVVHSSLYSAAPHGYRMLRPEGGGDITRIAGGPVPGGKIDNAAYYTGLSADGLPTPTSLVAIEAKNLRQWIYPQTQELYQVLDKSARLRLEHPNLNVLPVLVCRKAHYLATKMAQQLGFHIIATSRQYVRPAVAGTAEDARKFDEVNAELDYNLELNEGHVAPMIRHFTKVIPARIDEACTRWANFVEHPDVPRLISLLRDDSIVGEDRTDFHVELIDAAGDVFGEDIEWRHD